MFSVQKTRPVRRHRRRPRHRRTIPQRFLSSAQRAVAVVVPTTGVVGTVVVGPAVVAQTVAAVAAVAVVVAVVEQPWPRVAGTEPAIAVGTVVATTAVAVVA